MAQKYLGETLDIHCGGIDLIPIHHTNEIAQAEAVTGKPFARFWLHGEFVVINPFIGAVVICAHCGTKNTVEDKDLKKEGGFEKKCSKCGKTITAEIKMSKSDDNFTTLLTIKEKNFNPLAFRYLTFTTHYRMKLNFSWKALQAAQNALNNIYALVANLGEPKNVSKEFEQKFLEIVNDDLNMPKALAIVWELLKSDLSAGDKKATLLAFDEILGLDLKKAKSVEVPDDKIPDEIKKIVSERYEARTKKDWKKADELRAVSAVKGYDIVDTNNGQQVQRKDW